MAVVVLSSRIVMVVRDGGFYRNCRGGVGVHAL